jgi:hypothetical protein
MSPNVRFVGPCSAEHVTVLHGPPHAAARACQAHSVVSRGQPAALQHLRKNQAPPVLQCTMNRGTRLTPLSRPLQDSGSSEATSAMLPCSMSRHILQARQAPPQCCSVPLSPAAAATSWHYACCCRTWPVYQSGPTAAMFHVTRGIRKRPKSPAPSEAHPPCCVIALTLCCFAGHQSWAQVDLSAAGFSPLIHS